MSRPRKRTITVEIDRETLFAAQEELCLRRTSDVLVAGLLTVLENMAGRHPGRGVFVPAYSINGSLRVIGILRSGYSVCLACRGRLRTYKPGTLRAARLEWKLLSNAHPALRRLAHTFSSFFTADEWQALADYDGPVVGGNPLAAMPEVGRESWPAYEPDVAAWAVGQSRALRNRDVTNLDFDRLADEILDVAKAEKRELASRVSELMITLVKSNLRCTISGRSKARLARERRKLILLQLESCPSLSPCLHDQQWLNHCWSDAVISVAEGGLSVAGLPEECPWTAGELMG